MLHFSSGDSGVKDKSHSRWLHTAVTLQNEVSQSAHPCKLANGGGCAEKQCLVTDNLLYQIVIVLFVVVFTEINRVHWFWSDLLKKLFIFHRSAHIPQMYFSSLAFRNCGAISFFITFSTFATLYCRLKLWAVYILLSALLGIFFLCPQVILCFSGLLAFSLCSFVMENWSGRQNFARNHYLRRTHDNFS